ncbi:uncharacterized protein Z518_00848 [Rhinocladiella mackenziei CBS 650.93]|uniref:Uncharacterized protein n=1 Tax=Rhinocladiella mackenziei CBS 650.93 TaxID=1442369 RepID=A0A0D2G4V4_9EURO|nr:uncharacterized protein Z518_00848 [Rhinocladiella mackenziei CBS 650.93]KIX09767.1 hypothetical protein Z518_00848 [Rhinocladiella mackenziei CBS 650.93]
MHYESLNQPPPTGLGDDIEAIRKVVIAELNAGPTVNVALLTHSYPSVPGSPAIKSLDKHSRLNASHSNGIVFFLVISGLQIPAGTTPFAWGGSVTSPTMTLED